MVNLFQHNEVGSVGSNRNIKTQNIEQRYESSSRALSPTAYTPTGSRGRKTTQPSTSSYQANFENETMTPDDEIYRRRRTSSNSDCHDFYDFHRERQPTSPNVNLISAFHCSPSLGTQIYKPKQWFWGHLLQSHHVHFAGTLWHGNKVFLISAIFILSLAVFPFLLAHRQLIWSAEQQPLQFIPAFGIGVNVEHSKKSFIYFRRQNEKSRNTSIEFSSEVVYGSSNLLTSVVNITSPINESMNKIRNSQPGIQFESTSSEFKSSGRSHLRQDINEKIGNRFAYVYLVGGVDLENPAYRGFLYNIMISTYLQRRVASDVKLARENTLPSSIPDVVVLIKMKHGSRSSTLPEDEEAILTKKMNVKVQYIPTSGSANENFNTIMMEKFRVWNMTQYDRIIFLDSDMFLLNNLDYFFDMSVSGKLQTNVIMAQRFIPAGGHLFLMKPNATVYQQISNLVSSQNKNAAGSGDWNYKTVGWGEQNQTDVQKNDEDYYELSSGKKLLTFDFPGYDGDQGLLYYVTKYIDQSVSILFKEKVHNWYTANATAEELVPNLADSPPDARLRHVSTVNLVDLFGPETTANKKQESLLCSSSSWIKYLNHCPCISPFMDYIHFQGLSKPWLHNVPADLSNETSTKSPLHYWYFLLGVINDRYGLGLHLQEEWMYNIRPLLGIHPVKQQNSQKYRSEDITIQTADADATIIEDINQQNHQYNESSSQNGSPTALDANTSAQRRASQPFARFAYAYVVGGCDPDNPVYRNYIYDILISTYNQRFENSQADVVILFQMLYKSKYDTLPSEDIRILNAMDIKVLYIPKSKTESFYKIMLDKFRVLELTQYERGKSLLLLLSSSSS